jgi:hypothetical protein
MAAQRSYPAIPKAQGKMGKLGSVSHRMQHMDLVVLDELGSIAEHASLIRKSCLYYYDIKVSKGGGGVNGLGPTIRVAPTTSDQRRSAKLGGVSML